MDNLPNWAKIVVPKLAGFLAGLIASWLTTKGFTVTPENHETIALLLVGVFAGVGGAVKTFVTAHLNPANVNSPQMAGVIHEQLKEDAADLAEMDKRVAQTATEKQNGGA
jgi:hypothetical protein